MTFTWLLVSLGGIHAVKHNINQAWGEYWTKVLEYKYKYLKKWRVQVQVQVLDFQKYLSTSTSTLKSTRVQVPSTLVINSYNLHEIY